MKVQLLTDYRDRYGVEHKRGDVAEFADAIAAKIVTHRIGRYLRTSRPMAAAPEEQPEESAVEQTVTEVGASPDVQPEEPVAEQPEVQPVKRAPGRPRKPANTGQ